MTILATDRQVQTTGRRLSADSVIVYGLFAVTLVLLVAGAITGWRAAKAPMVAQGAAVPEAVG